MAKEAKGFAGTEGEAFKLITPEEEAKKPIRLGEPEELIVGEAKPIVLNIGEAIAFKKLFEKPSVELVELTGNPVIDFFKKINAYFISKAKVKITEKAQFFRLLSVMINSGLTIIKSLDILSIQAAKNPKLRRVIYDLARQVEQGKSLSEAMQRHRDVFDEAQTGMVKSGEASGQLNVILQNIAEELEKSASVRGKIIGAMIYPIVIVSLLVVVIFIMMVAVIPKISELFAQQEQQLPIFTKWLIATSNFMQKQWYVIVLGFIVIVLLFQFWKRTPQGRYQWDAFKLKIPLFGNLIQKGLLSRFARSLSNLLGSGVPIVATLRIISGAIGNEVYKDRLLSAAKDLEQGIPLAENLSASPLFPTMLVNMIQVGEQTAQLEQVTEKVAAFYDEEVDNAVKGLTKIIEPVILVLIGVTVGGVVAAVMLPIIQLTGTAGGV